jgi:hypothetical protein
MELKIIMLNTISYIQKDIPVLSPMQNLDFEKPA